MVAVPEEMIYIDWSVVQEAVEKQRLKQFIDEDSRFIYILDVIYVYLVIIHQTRGFN